MLVSLYSYSYFSFITQGVLFMFYLIQCVMPANCIWCFIHHGVVEFLKLAMGYAMTPHCCAKLCIPVQSCALLFVAFHCNSVALACFRVAFWLTFSVLWVVFWCAFSTLCLLLGIALAYPYWFHWSWRVYFFQCWSYSFLYLRSKRS